MPNNEIQRMIREASSPSQAAHGDFTAQVLRGNSFWGANQAGVASQAGLSATTPVLTLWNPLSSGVYVILNYASVIFPVACGAAADVWLAVSAAIAAAGAEATGTATPAKNALIGGSAACKAQLLLAATLPAAPVALDQMGVEWTGAITTAPGINAIQKRYDGGVILQPGTGLSIQTSTASGANGMLCSYFWEEVPVNN